MNPKLRLSFFACYVSILSGTFVRSEPVMDHREGDGAHIVDLSHKYYKGMVVYPGHTAFNIQVANKGDWPGTKIYVYSNQMALNEHTGTHLDAPAHFNKIGPEVDDIELEKLQGLGVVIDAVEKAANDPDYALTVKDLTDWEDKYGEIPEGAIILMRTNWYKKYGDRQQFFGGRSMDSFHWPGIGVEAARWLAEERQPSVVAVETISLDAAPQKDFMAHQILLGRNISGIEMIANLDQLPEYGSWVYVLPMNIKDGSGGPSRVFAISGQETLHQMALSGILLIVFAYIISQLTV